MLSLIVTLSRIAMDRLSDWDLHDYIDQWLENWSDSTSHKRSQWFSWIHSWCSLWSWNFKIILYFVLCEFTLLESYSLNLILLSYYSDISVCWCDLRTRSEACSKWQVLRCSILVLTQIEWNVTHIYLVPSCTNVYMLK